MGTVNPHFQLNHVPGKLSYFINPRGTSAHDFTHRDTEVDVIPERQNLLVILINSVYYFLECVYILERLDHFYLVAIHNGRVLTYRGYNSLRGAKIAFQNLYRDKAWKEGVKAEWTHRYPADNDWLEEKDELIGRSLAKEPLKAYSI